MDRPLLLLTEPAGQESPVEADIQLGQPRSRLPTLNGWFPASELPGAPPQPGQHATVVAVRSEAGRRLQGIG